MSQKNVLTLFFESSPRPALQERKRRSCVATIDIILYIYVVVYVCIMSLVATQLLLFLSCGACRGPDSKKRVSTFS